MNVSAGVDEILQGQGYVVLPELISAEQAAEARSLVLHHAEVERQAGTLFVNGQRERLYALIYRGEIFEQLVQHPDVMAIVEAILGADLTLGGFSAHILQPGAPSMGAHVDYPYFSLPQPYPSSPVLEIQAIWMLEDFSKTNGAPLFAPNSQTFCHFPDSNKFQQLAKPITGKAGSVVLSHGLCWHDTLPNTGQHPRISLLGNYNPKIIRPLENLTDGMQADVLDRATPKLRQLLGYDVQRSLLNDVMKLRSR